LEEEIEEKVDVTFLWAMKALDHLTGRYGGNPED
jgi:hypothetical protein